MKYDIFISYCRKDIEAVKAFKQEVEAATLATCWMDLDGIESGNPKFTKMIIRAINACPIFLFMLTEASQQSENALKELDFAYKKHREEGKKVVIVYVQPCQMNDEFSFDYAKADTIDWQNSLQREKLIRDLKEWTGYEEKMASQKEEEEKRRRQKEEQEKAQQEREAARAAKLKEIEDRLATLKGTLEFCETEQADLTAKIGEAKKQISDYEATIKVIDGTKKDLLVQIAECEKEKKALLGGEKKKVEKKEEKPIEKKKEKAYQPYQTNTQRTEEALLQRVLSWIKQLKKKYWVHIGLLVVLIVFIGISSYDFLRHAISSQYFALEEFLCIAWSAIASWGIIQLLQGKKNGMLTMLLNSATVYLYWYVDSEFSPYAFMGWGTFYLPFVLLLYLLHKKDTTSPLSWSKMKPCSIKRPRRLLTWMAAAYVFLAFAIPAIYSSAMGMTEYDMEEADNCTVFSLRAVCGDRWFARAIGDSYLPYGKYKYFETLEPDTEKALWWYELSGYTESIDHCKNYIEAEWNGFYMSDIYGKVGINPANRELVKIDIHKFNGDSLKSNQSYGINLIGADMSKGRLDVEGATLEESDGGISIKDIQGDSVVLRFNLIEHNGYYVGDSTVTTISERVIPVKRVAQRSTTLRIYPDDNAFRIGQVYNILVNNPIEDAEWEVYNEDINDLDIHIIESISERLAFVTKGDAQKRKGFMYTGDLCIKYNVNGTTICSARIKGQIQ